MNLFEKNDPFVCAVISGKGGVGKSMTSVNLAAMLNDMGYRTAIIDADLGLANCATMMGEPARATVADWINGETTLEELPQLCGEITLVTGADSPEEMTMSTDVLMDALDQVTEYLKASHDFVIIDTPAGAGEMTLWALDAATLGIPVLVDEPAAISDIYRLCKYVYSIDPEYNFACVVNFAENEDDAQSTHKRFGSILGHFLEKESSYLGFIPFHMAVREAIQKQLPVLHVQGNEEVASEIEFIAQNLISYSNKVEKPTLKLVYQ